MDVKALRRLCAECPETDYAKCRKSCPIYRLLNTPCYYCGRIPAPYVIVRYTSRGYVSHHVCLRCLKKLT